MYTSHTSARTATPPRLMSTVLAVLVVTAAPVWLYLQIFREALIDDTFITLQYVRTLRDYGVWGFYPWEVTNTATSPLNVLLTAITSLIVPDVVQAALLLATIEALVLLGLLLLLAKHSAQSYAFGAISFIAIMLNPLLISTLGLEPLLYTTLLVACIYAYMVSTPSALAMLLALLTLTRPDGFLLFPIMLGAVLAANYRNRSATTQPRRNLASTFRALLWVGLHFCLVYILCLTPWYLFSWLYLGSLVPHTLLIKRGQADWEGYNFFNGVLFYYQRYPSEVRVTLLLVPFALLCLWLNNRNARVVAGILFLFSSIYFIAYALLGVPPYHWYFVPVVIPWALLGVLGLTSLVQRLGSHHPPLIKSLLYIFPCGLALAGLMFVTDIKLLQSPIHTNWATHNRYREIALWLGDNVDAEANIQVRGEIGTVAYYSERRLVDVFSCRLSNREIARQIQALRGVRGFLARANFRWLRTDTACTPPAYELVMYNYNASVVEFPPNALKEWVISTDWVPVGRVALARK